MNAFAIQSADGGNEVKAEQCRSENDALFDAWFGSWRRRERRPRVNTNMVLVLVIGRRCPRPSGWARNGGVRQADAVRFCHAMPRYETVFCSQLQNSGFYLAYIHDYDRPTSVPNGINP